MEERSAPSFWDLVLARAEANAAQKIAYLELSELPEGKVRFERAVKIASIRLKDTIKIESTGIGINFLIGQLGFHKYLPVEGPLLEANLERLVEAASKDYEAYQVLEWVTVADPRCSTSPSIRRWQFLKHLGLFSPPKRPSGSQSFQNVHRDTLIVGEINSLTHVGFKATRNRVKKHRPTNDEKAHSACDVISSALTSLGKGISYEAVESVWINRDNLSSPKLLAALFPEMIDKALDTKR